MSTEQAWSPGQRALLRFLEREGLVQGLPQPPPGDGVPDDERLFATIAELVPPAVLAEMLAARLHLPVLESDGEVDATAVELLAAAVATRCGVVPVALAGQTLEVATANPLDLDAVKTVEFATGKRVRVRVATPETMRRALARVYGGEVTPAPAAAEPVAPPPAVEPEATAEVTPVVMVPDVAEAPVPPETLVDPEPVGDVVVSEPEPEAGPVAAEVTWTIDVEPEPTAEVSPAPRAPRVLVMVGDALERERLGAALHEAEPGWIVVTAQDAGEGALIATVVRPDVVIVESETTAGDVARGALAACPLLVADDYGSVDELATLARTLIDTARCG